MRMMHRQRPQHLDRSQLRLIKPHSRRESKSSYVADTITGRMKDEKVYVEVRALARAL